MLIVRLFMGKGLAKMFRWINDNNALFIKNADGLSKEFPGMLSLEEWIKVHFKN